jgi:hypothetical protein
MAMYAGIAAIFVILLLAIFQLRRPHSGEIYVIWYIFSFFGLIFFYLYFTAESKGKEITDVFGESSAKLLATIYSYLTSVEGEFQLVVAVVCLAVAPQLLAYFLSGLSGSATSPMFARQIGQIAIWSLIKFMATLGGILLADPLAKFCLGKQVSASDFVQPIPIISTAIMLAVILHQCFDQEFELHLMPGFRVHVRVPMLLKIHEFFTRFARQPATSSSNGYQRLVRIPSESIADLFIRLNRLADDIERQPREGIAQDAVKTPEREWQLNVRGIIFHFRGLFPVAILDWLKGPEHGCGSRR